MQRSKLRVQMSNNSFNNLISLDEYRLRNGKVERLGGFEIDHQLELGGLQDRQIGWLLALEDAADIDAKLAIQIRSIYPIAHQTAGRSIFAKVVHRRHRMARGQGHKLFASGVEKWVGDYRKGRDALLS